MSSGLYAGSCPSHPGEACYASGEQAADTHIHTAVNDASQASQYFRSRGIPVTVIVDGNGFSLRRD